MSCRNRLLSFDVCSPTGLAQNRTSSPFWEENKQQLLQPVRFFILLKTARGEITVRLAGTLKLCLCQIRLVSYAQTRSEDGAVEWSRGGQIDRQSERERAR